MSIKEVVQEDYKLANDVLERNYYRIFRDPALCHNKGLEIILLGSCTANCEYCYWKQYTKDLYPWAVYDENKIIENFRLILQWYKANDFKCEIEIFSGQWLDKPFCQGIFDVIYEEFKDYYYKPDFVCPDNMQFLKSPEAVQRFQNNKARLDSVGIPFTISCSIDGLECEYGRTPNDDEFYNFLIDFSKQYHMALHPMISSHNAKDWIKNHKWFVENFTEEQINGMTMLEVRDGTWDDDSIEDLIRFCDYLSDWQFERLNYDKRKMLQFILKYYPTKCSEEDNALSSYNPLTFNFMGIPTGVESPSCTFTKLLMIRALDLALVPCHRQSYDELIYGKFQVDDNKITGLNPHNLAYMIASTHLKRGCLPKCENCYLSEICTGFCFGASYEDFKNPYVPQQQVCRMYKAKFHFLIYKYYSLGIFDLLDTDPFFEALSNGAQGKWIKDIINEVVNTYEK